MRTIYALNKQGWPKGISLISEDSNYVVELDIKYKYNKNYRFHYLGTRFQHCKAIPNKPIEDYFFENSNQYKDTSSHYDKLIKLDKIAGEYHPRVYRPILHKDNYSNWFSPRSNFNGYDYFPHEHHMLVQSVQQLGTLINRLTSIFNNVYPTQNNFECYGHEIRNLLILACTEVEAQLKGILTANSQNPLIKCTTKHYAKLKGVLKLEEYSINLSHYPEVTFISPFKNWDQENPTTSLPWYDNYNSVKHDRENKFHNANLISAINAICAVAILLYAQYGDNIPNWKELIGNYFDQESVPNWEFEEYYFPPFHNEDWIEKKLNIT